MDDQERVEKAKRAVLRDYPIGYKMGVPSRYDPVTGTWLKLDGNILHGKMGDMKLEASDIIIVIPFPNYKEAMETFDELVESARR